MAVDLDTVNAEILVALKVSKAKNEDNTTRMVVSLCIRMSFVGVTNRCRFLGRQKLKIRKLSLSVAFVSWICLLAFDLFGFCFYEKEEVLLPVDCVCSSERLSCTRSISSCQGEDLTTKQPFDQTSASHPQKGYASTLHRRRVSGEGSQTDRRMDQST